MQPSKMASQNPVVLDDEAIERPPYTGVHQWTAAREAATKDSAINSQTAPNLLPSLAASKSASKSASGGPSPQTSPNPTASAYMHIPVHITITPDQSSAPSQAGSTSTQGPARWHLPPQQVCEDGAKPTPVCGRWSKDLHDPPKRPKAKDAGPFKCPRCHYGYSKVEGVRKHFPKCVALNGNPHCDAWTDHHSYDAGAATRSGPIHLVQLGICELIIRLEAHPEWNFDSLEPPDGVTPVILRTEEEVNEAWKELGRDLHADIHNGTLEVTPELEALIKSFKEEGQWPEDEA